jgi:ribosomal protein S18 acetylase RimI-like enzyme
MGGLLAMSAPDGHVYGRGGAAELPGMLSMTPPGKYPIPMRRLLRYLASPRTWSSAGWPKPRFLGRLLRLLDAMDKMHLPGPHYYVQVLGVHPSHQGKGIGAELLRGGLELADREKVPAYLETSNPKNLAFYRRFGFETTSEVALSGGYPPLYAMRRPAKS